MSPIQQQLIRAGVKNLKEFGYPQCNESNILTDHIFSAFFKSMLEDNRGKDRRADEAIDGLLARLSSPQEPR
jgi:hypothetical protein